MGGCRLYCIDKKGLCCYQRQTPVLREELVTGKAAAFGYKGDMSSLDISHGQSWCQLFGKKKSCQHSPKECFSRSQIQEKEMPATRDLAPYSGPSRVLPKFIH